MEELVADLSSALERTKDPPSALSDTTIGTCDSPTLTPVRKAPKKRRARRKRRSDYPTLWDPSKVSEESNDSMEEVLKDYIENITMCPSDEEEPPSESVQAACRHMSTSFISKTEPYILPERAESDSLGEGVIGLTKRSSKRKRKLRRFSQKNALISNIPLPSRKRKLYCGFGKDNGLGEIENGLNTCGEPYYKLPPSRSQANDLGATCEDFNMDDSNTAVEGGDDNMVISGSDSTSSGNESEGFFTNDEGRLGDDEGGESTFEHDPKINPWWEDDKLHSDIEDDKFQKILNGVLDEYGIPGPNRGGGGLQARLKAKHVSNKKEYNGPLLMAFNRRITAFLQDHRRTDLCIPVSGPDEKDQIKQLASLYSLRCSMDNSKRGTVMLIKTRKSCKPDQQLLSSFLGKESKERRDDRPMAVVRRKKKDLKAMPVSQFPGPIPENNIGNQMLRDMGWTPGTGLGADRSGIMDPVTAVMRPRGLGLGHPWPS